MKKLLLCSIAATAAVAMPAVAQTQGGAQGNRAQTAAQGDACAQLIRWVHRNPENDTGLSPQQLRVIDQRDDQARCRQILADLGQDQQRNAQAGADRGEVVVQQPAPSVRIDQAEPRIVVRQARPDVDVVQGQPEIIVRQPAPQVTVNIPQPEIIVRMPEPQVRVSQAQPEVTVDQPQPQVQVVQPQEQARVLMEQNEEPQVQVIQPQERANIDVQRSGQPNVRYEAAEPEVDIQRAEGQPRVRFEEMGAAETGGAQRQQAPAADQAAAGATAAERTREGFQTADGSAGQDTTGAVGSEDTRLLRVSELMGMDVVNARGNQLGDIERLVASTADNRTMVILSHGGFLGLGEKRVAIPLDNMALAGDRMVVRGLTDDDIRAMPDWQSDNPNFRSITNGQQTDVRLQ